MDQSTLVAFNNLAVVIFMDCIPLAAYSRVGSDEISEMKIYKERER